MLLRDTNPSDFRVPTAPGRTIASDPAAEDALRRRNERDAQLALAHERARARTQMLKMFAEEGQESAGLVARTDAALKAYKASPGALKGDDFAALARDVRGQALSVEAMARARGRVVQTGKTLDTLIEATRAAPENFEAHTNAAREAIDGQKLPAKIEAAFRARLAEIPEAALGALIERDPAYAAELIKRREGPADATFGLDRATLRMLAKQAAAAIDQAQAERAKGANVAAMRAHADAAIAIEAAERGEGDEAGLTAWLAQAETIGPKATRTLRRQSKAAAKVVAERNAAAAALREKRARGEDLTDTADDTIAADLRSGDAERVMRAAERIVALEVKGRVARLPKTLIAEAHTLTAATNAGFTPTDALQHLRAAADLTPTDRTRRTTAFDRTVGGEAIANAIEQAFAIHIAGIAD